MNKNIVLFNTTIPFEVIIAANLKPIDANNFFINSSNPKNLVLEANNLWPSNTCAWIKGIYQSIIENKDKVHSFVSVELGDCSFSKILAYNLKKRGINITNFHYFTNYQDLKKEISILANYYHTTYTKANRIWESRQNIRELLKKLKNLYIEGTLSFDKVLEIFLITSDLSIPFKEQEEKIKTLIKSIKTDKNLKRVALIGVPPIVDDIFEHIKNLNAAVCYGETFEEFALFKEASDIVEQYLKFTYTSSYENRIKHVKEELIKREIEVIIFYYNSFCYRIAEITIWNEIANQLNIPLVIIEEDLPGKLSQQNILRLDVALE